MEDHVFVKEKQEKVDFSMPECDVTLALRSDKCDSRKTSCVPETNTTTWSFPFRGSYFSCVLWGILLHEFWLCGAFGIVGDVYTDLVTTYPKYAKDRYVEIQFSSTKKVVEENKKITWMKAVEIQFLKAVEIQFFEPKNNIHFFSLGLSGKPSCKKSAVFLTLICGRY